MPIVHDQGQDFVSINVTPTLRLFFHHSALVAFYSDAPNVLYIEQDYHITHAVPPSHVWEEGRTPHTVCLELSEFIRSYLKLLTDGL